MRDRTNELSPDQRTFLQAILCEPDTLDRVVKRMNIVPWRLSAWMRRKRFRNVLAGVVKAMRTRRKLEIELAAQVAASVLSRLAAGEKGEPLQLDAARAAIELCYKYFPPYNGGRGPKRIESLKTPQRSLVHPDVPREEALEHIEALESREGAD